MTSVSQGYIPASLANLPTEGGVSPGFRFAFRTPHLRLLLFVTHQMILTVDGQKTPKDKLSVVARGKHVRAVDFPKTDWVIEADELLELVADFPGGLTAERHHLKLEVLLGGGYAGGMKAEPLWLCEFEAEPAWHEQISKTAQRSPGISV